VYTDAAMLKIAVGLWGSVLVGSPFEVACKPMVKVI
jgi:hypothetical protein